MMITQLLNVSGDKKYKFEARCKAQIHDKTAVARHQ